MIKPILWTIVCILTVIMVFASVGGGIWSYVIIIAAAACAFLQWAVYLKRK